MKGECDILSKKRRDMEKDRIANYNEHTFALLKAVASNDVEQTRALITKDECKSIIDDTALFLRPFPLHYVTLCYEAIWRDADERKDKEWALAVQNSTNAMIEFWKEYYGVDGFPRIEYHIYNEDFYCAWDDETDEDILFKPKSEFIAFGKREIDLDLYCAVERFQFDKVEELLKQGANPLAEIYDGLNDNDVNFDFWSAIERIVQEVGFLRCEVTGFMHQLFSKQAYWILGEELFRNILGLAAHLEMFALLKKYEKTI